MSTKSKEKKEINKKSDSKTKKVKKINKKEDKEKKPRGKGRPVKYTKKVFDVLCKRISNGESLNKITKDKDMPDKETFYRWIRLHEDLSTQYTLAKQDRADTYADEIVDIADNKGQDKYIDEDGNEKFDNEHINRTRLRIDARKWIASKLHPRNYGEWQKIDISGKQVNYNVKIGKKELKLAKDNLKKMLISNNI